MRSVIDGVKKITNGFRTLYKEYRLITAWKATHKLTWTEMKSYQASPKVFQESMFARVFARAEMEQIKHTLKSVRKIGFFFIVQLVPIVGYIPIAIALIFPRHILTSHFWSEEQKSSFRLQLWQEKFLATSKLYYQFLEYEDGSITDESFEQFLLSRRSLFSQNLQRFTPFPYSLHPSLREKYYLILLAQSQGLFSSFSPVFLTLLPRRYFQSKLQTLVHQILNDEYILHSTNQTIEDYSNLPKEDLQELVMTRGFHPHQELLQYYHYWMRSSCVESLSQRIMKQSLEKTEGDEGEKVSFHYAEDLSNLERKNAQSTAIPLPELLLWRIAWNTLRSKRPIAQIV